MAKTKQNVIQTNELDDLMFKVEKVQINDFACNDEYTHDIYAYPDNKKVRVNSCSDRYALVHVSKFAPAIRQIVLDSGLKFTENYQIINNAVLYGTIDISDKDFYIGNAKDNLQMRLTWEHSYNGKEQYSLNMGTFKRVLCSNGIWMTSFDTKEYGLSISGRHTIKIHQSLKMLENKLQFVLDNNVMQKAAKLYLPLYDNWVSNWEDKVLELMKIAGIGATENNVTIIKGTILSEVVDLESNDINYQKKGVNDWLLYNGINNFLFNSGKVNAFESVKRAKDQKVLETLLNN